MRNVLSGLVKYDLVPVLPFNIYVYISVSFYEVTFYIEQYGILYILYIFLLCFTIESTYIPLLVYIFHYSEKYGCYACVSMTLTLFCIPVFCFFSDSALHEFAKVTKTLGLLIEDMVRLLSFLE